MNKLILSIINLLFIINVFSIKISVIMPVYNTGKYLERILNAVINQTLHDIEIICIDDGSKDNSLKILKEYEKKDIRIRVIHFDDNLGQGVARNKGIELAKGEFLSFMDSDDYVDKRYLEYLYSFSEGYDVVVNPFARGTNDSDDYFINKLPHNENGFLYDSIFRKEFIDKYNLKFPLEKESGEDRLFRIDCYKNNPRIYEAPDKGIYYYYKERTGSTWKKSKRKILQLKKRAKIETEERKKNKNDF